MKNLAQKAEALRQEAINFLIQHDKAFRIESKHYSTTIIPITAEDLQYNLDGGRYLTEIDIQNEKLIDNQGYQYNLDVLSDEQLFNIVDTIKENSEKDKQFRSEQLEILEKIQSAGFNVVTCGNCGDVILHVINNDDEVHCGACNRDMDKSDCPDLYH